ncbi:MAG: TIGR02221 family CRISPR-associated protein [Sulfolobales archaeon]
MKAISFLGTGDYKEVTYYFQDKEAKTSLFPEALVKIFEPEKLLLLVTPTAKDSRNFKILCERLDDLAQPVDIPEGRSERELWQIFEICTEIISKNDEILLDITHAFRSLPLIVFSAAIYLRRTKDVSINRIVYGAYEARYPLRTPPEASDRAPIFDLTLLLDLFDWLNGAELFLRRSDATLLAEYLKHIHREAWLARDSTELPKKLSSLGERLRRLSSALQLVRPRDIMSLAYKLLQTLDDVRPEVERWAKPFGVILEEVKKEAGGLSYESPDTLSYENLRKQLDILEYLLQKELFTQAILLSREWVVSWVALHKGEGDWLNKSYREEEIEEALNLSARMLQGKAKAEDIPKWFNDIPCSEEVTKFWSWLTNLRNDLAHCGMRENIADIDSIKERSQKIPETLRRLLEEGFSEHVIHGNRVTIDLKSIYGEVAKLDELPLYLEKIKELAGEGKEVILTGQAPVWLYLAVGHSLHGKALRLYYQSPTTGEILIFDHSPR